MLGDLVILNPFILFACTSHEAFPLCILHLRYGVALPLYVDLPISSYLPSERMEIRKKWRI